MSKQTVLAKINNTGRIPYINVIGPVTRNISIPLQAARSLKKLGYDISFIDPETIQPIKTSPKVAAPKTTPVKVVVEEKEADSGLVDIPEETFKLADELSIDELKKTIFQPEESKAVEETSEKVEEVKEPELDDKFIEVDLDNMSKNALLKLAEELKIEIPKKASLSKIRKILDDALEPAEEE